MIREGVLNIIRSFNIIGKIYVKLILTYSKISINYLNSYERLTILCNLQRRIPELGLLKECFKLIESIIQDKCCKDNKLLPIEKNQLLKDFYQTSRFVIARRVFSSEKENDRLRLRHFRDEENFSRQGNIIIVKKPKLETGEKGVILIKYTPTFEHFQAVFNIASISKEYRMVFEPSSYRNIESSLFLYSGLGLKHILQGASGDDIILLEKFTSSISAIDLGSADWIDPSVFYPSIDNKIYDIVMVASWAKLKRHHILFKALRELKNRGKKLRVALIGYPMDMKKKDIINKARKYGVESLCDIFEQLSPLEVSQIVSSSKIALHLSKYEGTNKASYEAWMCNVPLIVYKYNSGFRKNYVNEKTGILSDDNEMADSIEYILNNSHAFSPREWLMKHSGYLNATKKLNDALKEIAIQNGEPWSEDIVAKKNGPNFLYACEEDRIAMDSAYSDLGKHFIV